MNIRRLTLCASAIAAFFAPALFVQNSQAQDAGLQSYEIELIIFRATRPMASPESWALAESAGKSAAVPGEDEAPAAAVPAGPPTTVTPPAQDTSFPALNQGQFRLNAVEDSLRKGRNYQPLAHIGWTQPGFPLGSSPLIPLPNYLPGFLPEGVTLSGNVSLSRGARLLHLMVDITYQAPDGQRYVLRETRRMRSTERHYLDHPYFGVIALVIPKT